MGDRHWFDREGPTRFKPLGDWRVGFVVAIHHDWNTKLEVDALKKNDDRVLVLKEIENNTPALIADASAATDAATDTTAAMTP